MKIAPFKLERYFAEHEFATKYLLCTSDCKGLEMSWLLEQADEECGELWENLTLGYTESTGHPLLREEIAKLYRGIEPEQVLVVSGPAEGIFVTCNALLNRGDGVITTWPGYQSLYEVPAAIGCKVFKWPLKEGLYWQPELHFLEDRVKAAQLLVINFPHNPTGFLPTITYFEEIIKIAKGQNLYILSDEVYRGLEYTPWERLPSAIEVYEKSIVISGMSKAFALAGLRIGWIIAKDKDLLAKIASFKDYTTICSSAPAEILSIIALRNRGKILERNINIIKKNLNLFESYLGEFRDGFLSWVQPEAGSVFFPKLLGRQDIEVFCEDIRREEGVLLLPASVFDYPANSFRIGLGRLDFEEGIARLARYIKRNLC